MANLDDFQFVVKRCADLSDDERADATALFQATYRDANVPYLEKSFGLLTYAAFARSDGKPAGFALGDMRVVDLPRLPQEAVAMAGICCVLAEHRRRGLFGHLERLCMMAGGIERTRWLACGRTAHPASMRTILANPTGVPRPGVPPTPWQKEVGVAVAALYGVQRFDPETFVCSGAGAPIGFPIMEIEATPDEWELFRHVDRDRGDSLLGLSWWGEPPDGW